MACLLSRSRNFEIQMHRVLLRVRSFAEHTTYCNVAFVSLLSKLRNNTKQPNDLEEYIYAPRRGNNNEWKKKKTPLVDQKWTCLHADNIFISCRVYKYTISNGDILLASTVIFYVCRPLNLNRSRIRMSSMCECVCVSACRPNGPWNIYCYLSCVCTVEIPKGILI